MILNTIAEKLKRRSKDDFKGRQFEAWLIIQAVSWYLRYLLSYRDLEEMFNERGFAVDHSRECPVFCVFEIWSMLRIRSKDYDDIKGSAGRASEGLRAA